VPADAGSFRLLRLLLGQKVEIRERGLEGRRWPSSRMDVSAAQRLRCWIARVKRPCAVPLTRHPGVGAGLTSLSATFRREDAGPTESLDSWPASIGAGRALFQLRRPLGKRAEEGSSLPLRPDPVDRRVSSVLRNRRARVLGF
jgi:hypothetical protein